MLRSVSYIRAVAIALVVAAHVQAKWQALSPATHTLDHAVLIFLHGGAISIFVVVAGFLFYYQQWQRVVAVRCTTTTTATTTKQNVDQASLDHEEEVEENANDVSSADLALPLYTMNFQKENTLQEKKKCQQHHHYPQRYLWKDFDSVRYIKSRIRRIGRPYILISLPILFHRIYVQEQEMGKQRHPHEEEHWTSTTRRIFTKANLRRIVTSLCSGRDVNYAYWFIPLILLLCCLSPLVVVFLTTFSPRAQVYFLMGWYYVVFFLIQGGNNGRPPCKDCWWQLVLYFFPMYLTGALLSMYVTTRMVKSSTTCSSGGSGTTSLGRWTLPLVILLVLVLVFQVQVIRSETGAAGNHTTKQNWSSLIFLPLPVPPFLRHALHLVQTLLTCAFAFTASYGYNYRQARPAVVHVCLQHLADTGFEIYLIHPWVIRKLDDCVEWKDRMLIPRTGGGGWLVWWWETVLVLVISMSLAMAWQRGQQLLQTRRIYFGCGSTGSAAAIHAHGK